MSASVTVRKVADVMKLIRIIPVVISFLLIAAHFYRAGVTGLAVVAIAAPWLLLIPRLWSAWIVQLLLVLSALEWARTLLKLVQLRMEMGMDWLRLALVLGMVILFTLISALIVRSRK